ncbi:MAG: branched-chain amino acid ABC transporter permease [Syntrophobacteraceae bacterium]
MEFVTHFLAVYGSLLNFIGIQSLLALSLYITLSAGQLSLGNAAFAGIGGYVSGVLSLHYGVSYILALVTGSASAGVVALAIGLPVLRLRGVFLAMATLAFGEVVRIAAVNLTITGGAQGLVGIPNRTKGWMIYLVLAAVCYVVARLRGSRVGWSFATIREDETAASTLGIHTIYYKTLAFVIGAVIAGLAGGMYAHLTFIISPGEFGFSAAVQLLIYNIVGGTRTWPGPILGAVLLIVLPEVLRGIGVAAGALRMAVNGLVLLLVILFLPNGLASLFQTTSRQAPKVVPLPKEEA